MLHIKFGFGWPSGFREEDLRNCGRTDGRTTDGRTPDHGHPISSPCEPNGSGELKSKVQIKLKVNLHLKYAFIRYFTAHQINRD